MEIDRKTLKALSADTRLDILKSLGKRRKMPSELSKEMGLAASPVIEHLSRLEDAGLVRREETGHKWIYYNLTAKGESLIRPKVPMQFVIVLGLSVMIVASVFFFSTSYYVPAPDSFSASGTLKDTAMSQTRITGEVTSSSIESDSSYNTTNSTSNITDMTQTVP